MDLETFDLSRYVIVDTFDGRPYPSELSDWVDVVFMLQGCGEGDVAMEIIEELVKQGRWEKALKEWMLEQDEDDEEQAEEE